MRPQGLPRRLRVLRRSGFRAVLEKGASASDGLLRVHALANGGPEPRLGLAVGKAAGDSPARNRVKRLLREAFRLRRGDLPAGHDLVVSPLGAEAAARTLAEIRDSLLAVAARAAARAAKRKP